MKVVLGEFTHHRSHKSTKCLAYDKWHESKILLVISSLIKFNGEKIYVTDSKYLEQKQLDDDGGDIQFVECSSIYSRYIKTPN